MRSTFYGVIPGRKANPEGLRIVGLGLATLDLPRQAGNDRSS